jgi:bifunctional DNA-binding transcriptional regulator/antitoxin component of YhaV-PrlF toxin-antitoxin module
MLCGAKGGKRMASEVSELGQITLDREVQEELGVEPGMIAYQRVVDGHLEVFFLPAPHNESLFDVFHREGQKPIGVTGEEIEEIVREAVAEKYARLRDSDD